MGVWVRIVMYFAAGWLVNAGWTPEVVDMLMGDPSTAVAVEQILMLVAGAVVGMLSLVWRKVALRLGWST